MPACKFTRRNAPLGAWVRQVSPTRSPAASWPASGESGCWRVAWGTGHQSTRRRAQCKVLVPPRACPQGQLWAHPSPLLRRQPLCYPRIRLFLCCSHLVIAAYPRAIQPFFKTLFLISFIQSPSYGPSTMLGRVMEQDRGPALWRQTLG